MELIIKEIEPLYPIGLKVNCNEVPDATTLDRIVNNLKGYHQGSYVIGKDTKYCEQPHYHIHFWGKMKCKDSKNAKNALKVVRNKYFSEEFSRSLKLYLGQDLPSSDKNMWLGYALKEEIIKIENIENIDAVKICAGSQLQIKQMKNVKSEQLKNKDIKKKELKDKILLYIKEKQPSKEDRYGNIEPDNSEETICKTIIEYFIENDMDGHLQRNIIQRYYKMYIISVLEKDKACNFLYNYIFK